MFAHVSVLDMNVCACLHFCLFFFLVHTYILDPYQRRLSALPNKMSGHAFLLNPNMCSRRVSDPNVFAWFSF